MREKLTKVVFNDVVNACILNAALFSSTIKSFIANFFHSNFFGNWLTEKCMIVLKGRGNSEIVK